MRLTFGRAPHTAASPFVALYIRGNRHCRNHEPVIVPRAGYDCRALRFRTPGVRFFEVDHPATRHDKRARLARLDQIGASVADVAEPAPEVRRGRLLVRAVIP